MSKKTADPTVDIAPVLGDTEALFPPSDDPVPEVAGAAVHSTHEAAHLLA